MRWLLFNLGFLSLLVHCFDLLQPVCDFDTFVFTTKLSFFCFLHLILIYNSVTNSTEYILLSWFLHFNEICIKMECGQIPKKINTTGMAAISSSLTFKHCKSARLWQTQAHRQVVQWNWTLDGMKGVLLCSLVLLRSADKHRLLSGHYSRCLR